MSPGIPLAKLAFKSHLNATKRAGKEPEKSQKRARVLVGPTESLVASTVVFSGFPGPKPRSGGRAEVDAGVWCLSRAWRQLRECSG